ncbi:TetR/AcrR family transcriptional regulator [Actinocorallia lasiicapitis]
MENGRQLRADARRNRERIMAAARAVFLEAGEDVQMEPIAKRAGVGIGTVYRNFPTKQILIEEVCRQWVEQRRIATEECLLVEDPAEAFTRFVVGASESMARDAGIRKALGGPEKGGASPEADEAHLRQLEALLAKVQPAGVVRADLAAIDLFGMMCGMAFAIYRGAAVDRCAQTLLRGLRPA